MSARSTLRRATTAVAALTALGGLTLLVEAVLAGRREYLQPDSAPPAEGEYGDKSLSPLRLVLLGDSTAAGVGARRRGETVGARLAKALSPTHHVQVRNVAVSGSKCSDLSPQVSRALLQRPDVAVILVGANDATHGTPPPLAARHLGHALHRLAQAGVPTVVGTCPDMAVRGFLPPLRQVVDWQGRQIARAQAAACARHHAASVDLAKLAGPAFHRDPGLLSEDEFHPGPRGYQVWADVLLPEVRAAVDARRSTAHGA